MTDLATLTYQDLSKNSLTFGMGHRHRTVVDERLSKPWKITYKKVGDSCKENHQLSKILDIQLL